MSETLNFLPLVFCYFLFGFATERITVYYVVRYMMRPAQSHTKEPLSSAAETIARRPGAGTLTFYETDMTSKAELEGPSNARYERLKRGATNMFLVYLGSIFGLVILSFLVVYLAASLFLPQDDLLYFWPWGLQLLLAIVLFRVARAFFWRRKAPIPSGFAYLTSILLLAPPLLALAMEMLTVGDYLRAGDSLEGVLKPELAAYLVNLVFWLSHPFLMRWMIHRNRRQAAEAGKQDLLFLRVFAMDRETVGTIEGIVERWAPLGACISIADPSSARYHSQYTGGIMMLVLFVVAFFVSFFATVWLGKEPFEWAHGFLMVGVMFLLLPFLVVPILASVRRRFAKDLRSLMVRIDGVLGAANNSRGFYKDHFFYCHDDLWQAAVQRMMNQVEVVLMDFRKFTPSNRGCEFEIGKVLDIVRLPNVVLLLDTDTDHDVVYQIFRERWTQLAADSPNRTATDPTLKVFTAEAKDAFRGSESFDSLLPLLVSAIGTEATA